jgi:sterile alpha motif and leucine zipper-containing kinase AZK
MLKTHMSGTKSITSPRWMAPEVLRGSSYDKTSDVYSFGVILWELITLKVPWEECVHPYQLVHLVVEQGQRPPIPDDCEPTTSVFVALCELMQQCWAKEPERRPSFLDALTRLRAMSADVNKEAKQAKKQGATSKKLMKVSPEAGDAGSSSGLPSTSSGS